MYKLLKSIYTNEITGVQEIGDGYIKSIPFDPANTDYQAFKKDLANGVSLEDATGTAMTADQITTFLATLK